MADVQLNWLAVLGATAVLFILGALWYGPLFSTPWMREIGMDPEQRRQMPKKAMKRLLSLTFILEWLMAMCLAMFLGNKTDLLHGALYGFLTGLPWIGFAIAVNAMFEGRSFKYILINASYWTLGFTLMGAIIGWGQYAG